MKQLLLHIQQSKALDKDTQYLSLLIKEQTEAILKLRQMQQNNATKIQIDAKIHHIEDTFKHRIEEQMAVVYAQLHKLKSDFSEKAYEHFFND